MTSTQEEPKAVPASALVLLGVLLLALCAGILWLSFRFELDGDLDQRPILEALSLFGLATLIYLAALALVLRRADSVRGTIIIVGFAVIFRLVLLPSEPIQEIDFYRYLWDGRVLSAGFNPFHYSQRQIEVLGPDRPAGSELHALWQLSEATPAQRQIFNRVHHRQVPTVYPPAAQLVFGATAWLVPASAPFWIHVLALKTVLVGFDLGTLGVLILILRRLGKPTTWCLAYGWCPLTLKELANSAHLDSIAVFFTVLMAYWLIRALTPLAPVVGGEGPGVRGQEQQDTPPSAPLTPTPLPRSTGGEGLIGPLACACLGAACLALAILAKSYPIILTLLVVTLLIARLRWRSLLPIGLIPLIVIAGYLPFARPPADYVPGSEEDDVFLSSAPHHPGSGLRTFLTVWEMNDFFFMVVSENLRPAARPEDDRWFVVTPQAWRRALETPVAQFLIDHELAERFKDPAFLVTQILMATLLMTVCLAAALGAYRDPGPESLLRGLFLTLFWGWMFSSTQNPWYLLWSLPFMLFAGRRAYFLMTGLVLLYYVRFWFEYHTEEVAFFDFKLVWLEYAPFLVALLIESWWQRRNRRAEPEPIPA